MVHLWKRSKGSAVAAFAVTSILVMQLSLAGAEPPSNVIAARRIAPVDWSPLREFKGDQIADVTQFGAKGDCVSDDWQAFQQAELATSRSGGGIVVVPPPRHGPCYRIRQALRLQSNVTLVASDITTTIECTADVDGDDAYGGKFPFIGRYPFSGCWMIGGYEGREYQSTPSQDLAAIVAGDRDIAIAPPSAAQLFEVGELVAIESRSMWQISRGDVHPTSQEINQISGIDSASGKLRLVYPTTLTLDEGQIRKLSHSGQQVNDFLGNHSGVMNWASWNSRIIGGRWIGKPEVPLSGGGGGLGDVISPDFARGFSLGVNLCGRCLIQMTRSETSGSVIELAYGTHDTVVRVGRAESTPPRPGPTPAQWYVAIDEGSRRNEIQICTHTFSASDAVIDEVGIISSSNNSIRIASVSGVSIRGPVISIEAPNFVGSVPPTTGNSVSIGNISIGKSGQLLSIVGSASANTVTNDNDISGKWGC